MRLENQQSTLLWRMGGLLACAVALGLAVATGGAALIPALLLLALGGHYVGRISIEDVVLSEHFRTLSVTRSRLFGSPTRTFPLAEITSHYQAHSSLRSPPYHTLKIRYRGHTIAELDPKQGYDRAGIDRLHKALLAYQVTHAVDTANSAASKP